MRDIFMLVLFLYISIRYGMGEILHIPGDWLSQTKNIPGCTTLYSPGDNFWVRYNLKPPQNLRVPKGCKLLAKGKHAKAD